MAISSSSTAPANVIVQNNSVLTISTGVSLDIDFATNNLTVQSGSGVLIEAGGKITWLINIWIIRMQSVPENS